MRMDKIGEFEQGREFDVQLECTIYEAIALTNKLICDAPEYKDWGFPILDNLIEDFLRCLKANDGDEALVKKWQGTKQGQFVFDWQVLILVFNAAVVIYKNCSIEFD